MIIIYKLIMILSKLLNYRSFVSLSCTCTCKKASWYATKQEICIPPDLLLRTHTSLVFFFFFSSSFGRHLVPLLNVTAKGRSSGWKPIQVFFCTQFVQVTSRTLGHKQCFNSHTFLTVMAKDKREEDEEEKEERKEIGRDEEIRREIGKLRRQNVITHCLLSLLIVMTAGWQLTEISLILVAKDTLKDKLRNPFRALRDVIFRGFRGSGRLEGLDNLRSSPDSNQPLKVSPLPPVAVPELPHPDLPSLALLDGSE